MIATNGWDHPLETAIQKRRLTPDIVLWVNHIDSVYGQHRVNDAEITDELTARPRGARQYLGGERNIIDTA